MQLLEVCKAAIAYDLAIRGRARQGDDIHVREDGTYFTQGEDLDELYMDWMHKAYAALDVEEPSV